MLTGKVQFEILFGEANGEKTPIGPLESSPLYDLCQSWTPRFRHNHSTDLYPMLRRCGVALAYQRPSPLAHDDLIESTLATIAGLDIDCVPTKNKNSLRPVHWDSGGRVAVRPCGKMSV